jgi:hypothetical protein
MPLPHETKVEQVRALFEGREAIYVEKGALRVKVSDIRVSRLYISAEVEEIPTAGFPVGVSFEIQRREPSPLRWSIGCGVLTRFSEQTWHMGYGGWSLFFAPRIVEGILSLAIGFPPNLHPFERYNGVLRYLEEHGAYEPTRLLFEK